MNRILYLALPLFLIVPFFLIPDVSPGHDSPVYIQLSEQIRNQGFENFQREPAYPYLIYWISKLGYSAVKVLPVFQNYLFGISLFLFIGTFFPAVTLRRRLVYTSLLCLLPTYLIVMNGSVYTESISASMVLLLFVALKKLYLSFGKVLNIYKVSIWSLFIFLLVMILNFTKGSFLFVHIAFPVLLISISLILFFFSRYKVQSIQLGKVSILLLLIGISSKNLVTVWLNYNTHQPLILNENLYERGGVHAFGRVAYGDRFNFKNDGMQYLINGMSESVCDQIYKSKGGCNDFDFDKENLLGYYAKDLVKNRVLLFQMAKNLLFMKPIRQSSFGLLQLSKFTLHHSNRGFAGFENTVLKSVFQNSAINLILKVYSFFLVGSIPFLLVWLFWKYGKRVVELDLQEDQLLPILILTYVLSYSAIHMFTTTLVRMIYPVSALIVIFQIVLFFKIKRMQSLD